MKNDYQIFPAEDGARAKIVYKVFVEGKNKYKPKPKVKTVPVVGYLVMRGFSFLLVRYEANVSVTEPLTGTTVATGLAGTMTSNRKAFAPVLRTLSYKLERVDANEFEAHRRKVVEVLKRKNIKAPLNDLPPYPAPEAPGL